MLLKLLILDWEICLIYIRKTTYPIVGKIEYFWKEQKEWVLWPAVLQTSRSKASTSISSVKSVLKPLRRSPFILSWRPAAIAFFKLVVKAVLAFCGAPSGHTNMRSSGSKERTAFSAFSIWMPQMVPTRGKAQKQQNVADKQTKGKSLRESTVRAWSVGCYERNALYIHVHASGLDVGLFIKLRIRRLVQNSRFVPKKGPLRETSCWSRRINLVDSRKRVGQRFRDTRFAKCHSKTKKNLSHK